MLAEAANVHVAARVCDDDRVVVERAGIRASSLAGIRRWPPSARRHPSVALRQEANAVVGLTHSRMRARAAWAGHEAPKKASRQIKRPPRQPKRSPRDAPGAPEEAKTIDFPEVFERL